MKNFLNETQIRNIVSRFMVADDIKMNGYNGWSDDNESKIKSLMFDSITLKLSYDLFQELNLREALGKKYTEMFFEILNKRKDYDLNLYLFKDDLPEYDGEDYLNGKELEEYRYKVNLLYKEAEELSEKDKKILNDYLDERNLPDNFVYKGELPKVQSISTIKKHIKESLNRIKFTEECIYQIFYFDENIKDKFYAGDDCSLDRKAMSDEDKMFEAMNICCNCNTEDFYPKLVEEINDKLIGKENCIYDYYEFGTTGFCLYWNIHKSKYKEIMSKIKGWVRYYELENHIHIPLHDTKTKEETEEYIGSEKVQKDYWSN